jgi:hypothetical protein
MFQYVSILLWQRFYLFREHLKLIKFCVYCSHTLLHLNVYYIYLMPHDIDVRLLIQVLCFVVLIEQCEFFLIHWFLAHLAKGNIGYCHHWVRSQSSSSVCCYCNILIFSSETSLPIKQKLRRKYLCDVFYKECSFRLDPLTSMATTGNSSFWLADF